MGEIERRSPLTENSLLDFREYEVHPCRLPPHSDCQMLVHPVGQPFVCVLLKGVVGKVAGLRFIARYSTEFEWLPEEGCKRSTDCGRTGRGSVSPLNGKVGFQIPRYEIVFRLPHIQWSLGVMALQPKRPPSVRFRMDRIQAGCIGYVIRGVRNLMAGTGKSAHGFDRWVHLAWVHASTVSNALEPREKGT
ncbi:hypothetical protein ASG79_15605 [Arthrobacter sp. Soil761]|nr:hypothetical protein [Arthrobacter sp. Soil761]KRE64418.1 hypothetical protein ASG79_15605 [Arthrobacter sp. Soil761]